MCKSDGRANPAIRIADYKVNIFSPNDKISIWPAPRIFSPTFYPRFESLI